MAKILLFKWPEWSKELLRQKNIEMYERFLPPGASLSDVNGFNLELTNRLTGIRWDDSDKPRGLRIALQTLYNAVRSVYPDFCMVGILYAYDEFHEHGDYQYTINVQANGSVESWKVHED